MQVELSHWQSKVWNDPNRFKVINVGRRSGKSTLSVLKVIDFASNTPNSISWMISPTYKQTKQIAFELFRQYFPMDLLDKVNETELIFHLKNGSRILLKGAEDPDSLRGVRIDFCVLDEVAFINKWERVWKVIRPTLVDSKAKCWFISTPNGFNHFKELSEIQDKDYSYFHFTSYDNPYIDKEELDKAKLETDEDSFAQEYLGEFRKMSGLVYKEFNRDIHMVDIPDLHSYTFTRALDFGFAHKTALIYFAISPDGSQMYAYDGLYATGMVIPQIAEAVKIKDAGKIITNPVADSAQPASIAELNQLGISFSPVDKEKDSVKNGIVRVAELLKIRADTGKPTLMFNKHLTWIADEFERYKWMENKSADNEIKEVPYKANDDAMDCIRYFAMNYRKKMEQSIPYNKKKWSI